MDLKESVQRQFGAVAANYASSWVHRGGPDLTAMLEAADLRGSERVLDVGCGAGHTALAFAPDAAEVVALDLTEPMLEQGRQLARERGLTNLRFERGDVESLPFADASFDRVTSRYSAHHYPAPERALAEIRRVLRPGGRFLLVDIVAPETPTADTFLQAIELLRDPSHVRDHRISEWVAMLEAAGFDAERCGTFPCDIDFTAWIQRMQTPEAETACLRRLLDAAPSEAREALAIGSPGAHDFSLTTALLAGAPVSG